MTMRRRIDVNLMAGGGSFGDAVEAIHRRRTVLGDRIGVLLPAYLGLVGNIKQNWDGGGTISVDGVPRE